MHEELSDFQSGNVIGCHLSNKSVHNISALLELPRSTVSAVIVKWKCLGQQRLSHQVVGHTSSQKGTAECWSAQRVKIGCPWLQHLLRVQTASWSNASTITVSRELHEMGFHGQAAAHKPNIAMCNAKRLLEWCKAYHHWTLEQWKHVLWSDDSRFTIWQSDRQIWVWQIPGDFYLFFIIFILPLFN